MAHLSEGGVGQVLCHITLSLLIARLLTHLAYLLLTVPFLTHSLTCVLHVYIPAVLCLCNASCLSLTIIYALLILYLSR